MGEKELRGRTLPRRVLVITEKNEFVGYLHTMTSDPRETDILNDEKRFVHLTDVEVRIEGDMPRTVPFVAVNKASIICVIPVEETDF